MSQTIRCLGIVLLSLLAWPVNAQEPEQLRRPDQGERARQNRSLQGERKAKSLSERLNGLDGMIGKLNLDEDQMAEVRLIIRDFTEQWREQAGAGAADGGSDGLARRQALLQRLRNQGLQGQELKKAVQEALGEAGKSGGGSRPRELLVQRQAELISKVREVLNEEQQEKLDELLRERAEAQRAKREAEAAKKDGANPGADGQGDGAGKRGEKRKKGSRDDGGR